MPRQTKQLDQRLSLNRRCTKSFVGCPAAPAKAGQQRGAPTMGLALSPDILQFGAVLVKVCVKDFAFALGVFAVLVVGSPKLVAPANEGGPCGQSTNVGGLQPPAAQSAHN